MRKRIELGAAAAAALVLSLLLMGAASCPGPEPPHPPTPTPTPTSTPTPPPATICTFPQGVPQEDYVEVPNPQQFSAVVDATIREHTTCDGQTDCTWGPADPQVYLAVMISALQAKGYCAGQHINGETDQISVALSCKAGVTWENYQPVNYGGTYHKARFAPGNIMDGWQVPFSCSGGQPQPTPTPTPVPTPTPTPRPTPRPTPTPTPIPTPTPTPPPSGCPAGTPPPGQYVISCHVKPANPNMDFCDSTPKVIDRDYCAPAVVCPYKGGEGSDSRIACERALAWPIWTNAAQREDNPFSADTARGANIQVCARDFPGTCASAVTP